MTALNILKTLALSSVLFLLAACSTVDQPATLNTDTINQLTIKNLANPKQSVFTAGQASKEELTALADAGIKHVINLRPLQEQEQDQAQDWKEAELIKSLNMQYHSIPIANAADINIENATKLAELMKSIEGEPIFLHCASSNRVGALTAVYESAANGVNTEDAIAKGKRWGLSSLEPVVRAQLSAPQ